MVLWDSFCLNIVFYCVMGLFVRLTLFKIGLVLLFFIGEICLFWRNWILRDWTNMLEKDPARDSSTKWDSVSLFNEFIRVINFRKRAKVRLVVWKILMNFSTFGLKPTIDRLILVQCFWSIVNDFMDIQMECFQVVHLAKLLESF